MNRFRFTRLALGAAIVAGATLATAQPRFESAAPTAGGKTSQTGEPDRGQDPVSIGRLREQEQAGAAGHRHSRRDQEQQRHVPAEVHRQQHRRFRRARALRRQLQGAGAEQPRAGAARVRACLQPGRSAGRAQVPRHGQDEDDEVHREVRHPEDRAGRIGARELRRAYAGTDGRMARRFRRVARRRGRRGRRRHGAGLRAQRRGHQRVGDRHALQDHQRRDDGAARAGLHRGEDGSRRDLERRARAQQRATGRCRASTRWCSGWCRSPCGRSIRSTSNARTSRFAPGGSASRSSRPDHGDPANSANTKSAASSAAARWASSTRPTIR